MAESSATEGSEDHQPNSNEAINQPGFPPHELGLIRVILIGR